MPLFQEAAALFLPFLWYLIVLEPPLEAAVSFLTTSLEAEAPQQRQRHQPPAARLRAFALFQAALVAVGPLASFSD